MVIIKVLKRKDASSLIVGVVLAMIVSQLISYTSGDLAATLSTIKEGEGFSYVPPDASWKQAYLYPVVWAAVQIVMLEILAWIVIGASRLLTAPVKRKK